MHVFLDRIVFYVNCFIKNLGFHLLLVKESLGELGLQELILVRTDLKVQRSLTYVLTDYPQTRSLRCQRKLNSCPYKV